MTREKTKGTTTMGMAASQARLLSLTCRLNDIEYKAQNIESQKIALATQKDEVYQKYCDALDKKKIQIKFQNGAKTEYVDATFSNVCGYDPDRLSQYSLRDAKTGKIILDSETAEMYSLVDLDGYKMFRDKYTFAWAMMGFYNCGDEEGDAFTAPETSFETGDLIADELSRIGYRDIEDSDEETFMSDVERFVFELYYDKDPSSAKDSKLSEYYNNAVAMLNDEDDEDHDYSPAEIKEAFDKFKNRLYEKHADEIYKYMNVDKQSDGDLAEIELDDEDLETYGIEWDKNKFNYYVKLYESIEEAGGFVEMDPQYASGEDGKEWFNNMIQSGRVLIDVYNPDKKQWEATSVATSTKGNNLQEVQDDKDLKKIEAEYEHELSVINSKDTKFDQDLSKLETERTAITTEMESIKKVRNDNSERTFGIFG